jgi:hypothetical protein
VKPGGILHQFNGALIHEVAELRRALENIDENAPLVFQVELTSDSVIKSDSSGTIRLSVIPFPGKKKEGTARVKIMEPNCAPEVGWNWGPI